MSRICLVEPQVFSLPLRCSQDAEVGKILSDLFTNRKESIPLTFSEDCLYLNIYTPADLTKSNRLPVNMGTTDLGSWFPASGCSVQVEPGEGSWGRCFMVQD